MTTTQDDDNSFGFYDQILFGNANVRNCLKIQLTLMEHRDKNVESKVLMLVRRDCLSKLSDLLDLKSFNRKCETSKTCAAFTNFLSFLYL